MQEAALQLRTRLENTLDGNGFVHDTATALAVVATLDDMFITPETLEVTRLGRCVNLLRKKTTSEELSKRAKQLVKKWQKLVKSDCASRASTPNGMPFAPNNTTTTLLRRAAAEFSAAAEGSRDHDGSAATATAGVASTADPDDSSSLDCMQSLRERSAAAAAAAGGSQEPPLLHESLTGNAVPTPEQPVDRPDGPASSRQWHGVDGRQSGQDGGGEWTSWTECLYSADGTQVAAPYIYLE